MRLTKEEKIKALTWKYFKIRKTWELLILAAFIFIPYWIGTWVGPYLNKAGTELPTGFDLALTLWFGGFFIFLGIAVVCFLIYEVIKDNWWKARTRAWREIK